MARILIKPYRGRFPGMARSARLDGGEVSPLQSGRADAAGLETGTACEWLIAVGTDVLKNLSRCPAVASLSRSKKPATTSRSFRRPSTRPRNAANSFDMHDLGADDPARPRRGTPRIRIKRGMYE